MTGVIRGLAIARRLASRALFCTVLAAAAGAVAQTTFKSDVQSRTRAAAALTARRGVEPEGYWTGDVDAPTPAALRGGSVIHAADVAELLRQGGAVVVDVSNSPRPPPGLAPGAPWLPLPHRAIPGALWIPGAGAGALPPGTDGFFRTRLAAATAGDLDRPLVIYCHDRCWLSWNAAKRAIGYGYRRTYWFPEGIEGWTASGGPTAPVEPLEPAAAPPESKLPGLVVLDIELTGDLGGPELVAEHQVRLKRESARLRQDLEGTGKYRIVETAAAEGTIRKLGSEQAFMHECNGCDLEVGRELHADLVLVAWVYRVSGLILTLTYEIHDVNSGQIAARKSFDFRGDNDAAWNHAIDFMTRDLLFDSKK